MSILSVRGLFLPVKFYLLSVSLIVCLLDCLLVTSMYCGKTANLIEMMFEMVVRIGPRNHVLEGVQILQANGQIWRK